MNWLPIERSSPTAWRSDAIAARRRVLAEDLARGIAAAACSSRNVAAATPITTISAAASRRTRVAAGERQLSQTFSRRYAPPGLTAKPLTLVLVA